MDSQQSTTNLIPVTVEYRCGHQSELVSYPAVADYLRKSVKSWLCTPCRLRAPERKFGRGRGSVPFIGKMYA